MILWFVRHLFYFRSLLNSKIDVHQVALGCALGMMLGILPKGNLVALLLSMLLLSLRMHLGAAMVSMLVFSVVGYYLDPLTHRLGLLMLTNDLLAGSWARFYQLPLAPWTSLNNTVVAGSLLLGLTSVVPTYWLSKRGVSWLLLRTAANEANDMSRSEDTVAPPENAATVTV